MLGVGTPVRGEQLRQIHLVGAAHDRGRIVDHCQPLALGAAREAIGVVGDRRGLADQQRIELGETMQVLLADRLDLDAHLRADAHEPVEGRLARGRQGLLRVVQHGDAVARYGLRALGPPRHLEMRRQLAMEPGGLVGRKVGQRQRLDRLDHATARVGGRDHQSQKRMAEAVEHGAGEATEPPVGGVAEGDQQGHRFHDRLTQSRQALGEDRVQLRQREAVQRAASQIENGLHRGDHLVPARLGEQRGVVARTQILAVAAEIDHAYGAGAKALRPHDVDTWQADQFGDRLGEGGGRLLAQHDLHQRVSSRLLTMIAACSLDRP